MNRLGFRPVEVEGSSFLRWMACIDDEALADAVMAFEASKGFDVQGGYGGVPIRISKDSIDASNNDFARMNPVFRPTQGGHVILLECVCGFEGCWPLLAGLTVDDARVV